MPAPAGGPQVNGAEPRTPNWQESPATWQPAFVWRSQASEQSITPGAVVSGMAQAPGAVQSPSDSQNLAHERSPAP